MGPNGTIRRGMEIEFHTQLLALCRSALLICVVSAFCSGLYGKLCMRYPLSCSSRVLLSTSLLAAVGDDWMVGSRRRLKSRVSFGVLFGKLP